MSLFKKKEPQPPIPFMEQHPLNVTGMDVVYQVFKLTARVEQLEQKVANESPSL